MNAKKRQLGILISTILGAQTAFALPQGAQVVHGTADISQPSSSVLNINNSNQAIIHWNQFNIGAGQTVNFNQPSSSSSVLNQVISHNPSQLLGNLNSNGQVFLINQNGILVGEGARINTNGFFASTLNITNEDYLNGDLNFHGGGLAGIDNQGYIHAGENGNVVLIAPDIENGGVIEVDNGEVILAAGQSITIKSLDNAHIEFNVQGSENTVTNLGEIIAHNGAANLFAGTLKHSGSIKATKLVKDDSGHIRLVATDKLELSGSLDADNIDLNASNIDIVGNLEINGSVHEIEDNVGASAIISNGNDHVMVNESGIIDLNASLDFDEIELFLDTEETHSSTATLVLDEADLMNVLPQGAEVIHGTVDIVQSSSSVLNITNSDQAIIHWDEFNIGIGHTVNFNQTSSSSSVLNQVVSDNPSHLLGNLNSNGQVFLINQNGILVGEGARINTNGFFASTLNITNEDYLNGDLNFHGGGLAGIDNQGYIHVGENGNVVLIAPNIENGGVIEVDNGQVILAAGQSITIKSLDNANIELNIQGDEDAVTNLGEIIAHNGAANLFAGTLKHSGSIKATKLVKDDGGHIRLVATDKVEVSGSLDASGVEGGDIHVLGDEVVIQQDAVIDASGSHQGGEILIGGDQQGLNPNIRNATSTTIEENAIVTASATQTGDGGRVIIFAEDDVHVHGQVSATGGAVYGDGGFIETSGLKQLDITSTPDASASNGKAGEWLIDPNNIEIIDSTGSDDAIFTADPSDYTSSTDTTTLNVNLIEMALDNGTSVVITTGAGGSEAGDITLSADISKTGNTDASLTLSAHNDIYLRGDIRDQSSGGMLDLTLNPDFDGGGVAGDVIIGDGVGNTSYGIVIDLNGGVLDVNGDIVALMPNSPSSFFKPHVIFRDLTWDKDTDLSFSGYGDVSFDNSTITNSGDILFNGHGYGGMYAGSGDSSYLRIENGAQFDNSGTVSVIGHGIVTSYGYGFGGLMSVESGSTFNNLAAGTVNITASTDSYGGGLAAAELYIGNGAGSSFINNGIVNVNGATGVSGSAAVSNIWIDDSGLFQNEGTATVNLSPNGGDVGFNVLIGSLDLLGGTINGAEHINLQDTLNWQGGTLSGQTGQSLNVVAGATINATGSTGSMSLDGLSLTNDVVNFSLTIGDGNRFRLENGASLVLATATDILGTGTFEISTGSTFDLATAPSSFSSDITIELNSGSLENAQNLDVPNVFDWNGGDILGNSGTFDISGTSVLNFNPGSNSATTNLGFNVDGVLNIASSELILSQDSSVAGDLNIATNASLTLFNDGSGVDPTLSLFNGAQFSGNGAIKVTSDTSLDVADGLDIPRINNVGGSVTFLGDASVGSLTVDSGDVDVDGALSVDDLTWVSGTIASMTSGGVSLVTSGTSLVNEGTLNNVHWVNNGTLNWSGSESAELTFIDASFENSSSGVVNVEGAAQVKPTVTLQGKSFDLTNSTLSNYGAINLDGAQLDLGGITLVLNSGASLNGNGVVTGNVQNTSGTVSVTNPSGGAGSLAIVGNYFQGDNGTLKIRILNANNFDTFGVSGATSLNGNLSMSYVGNSSLPVSFKPFTFNNVSGNFSSITDTNGSILKLDLISGTFTIIGGIQNGDSIALLTDNLKKIIEKLGQEEGSETLAFLISLLEQREDEDDDLKKLSKLVCR